MVGTRHIQRRQLVSGQQNIHSHFTFSRACWPLLLLFHRHGKKKNPNSNCWETLHHLPCTISSSIQQRKSLHLLPCSCKLMLTSLQAGQLRLLFGTRDKPKFMTSVLFNLPYSVLLLNWAHFTLSISSEGQNRPCSNLQRCLMKTQALISWARL